MEKPPNKQYLSTFKQKFKNRNNNSITSKVLKRIGESEFSVLLVLFLLMGSVWGFIELAEEVFEGDTQSFDRAVLLSMRNADDLTDPIGPGWVEEIGRDFTALGGIAILSLLTLTVAGFLVLDGKRRVAVVVLVATLGGVGVSSILKQAFDRQRPDLVPHGSIVYTSSFPSGHSMLAASTYLTLGALLARVQRRRRIRAYILLVSISATLAVGISRVYLGVHWPTDVFAGWTAGAGWALLCWLLARKLQRQGNIENEYTEEPE